MLFNGKKRVPRTSFAADDLDTPILCVRLVRICRDHVFGV